MALIPFFTGFFISRWISTNATRTLEAQHKALLVDFSTGSQKYMIIWLILALVPIFIIPRAGYFIFATGVLVANWLTLKRLWAFDFPESYKQKSLIATIVFSIGVLISIIGFSFMLYLA
jgi:hypothetical protein